MLLIRFIALVLVVVGRGRRHRPRHLLAEGQILDRIIGEDYEHRKRLDAGGRRSDNAELVPPIPEIRGMKIRLSGHDRR